MKCQTAIVTGASGQDGFFLTQRLLLEGWTVYAVTRRPGELEPLAADDLHIVHIDMLDGSAMTDLIAGVQPEEIYNLAGISSVAASFANPRLAWSTNVDAVVTLLDAVRLHSPMSRVYQASSSEMFGYVSNESVIHSEQSPLRPASPYAAAKAAAHLLCQSYRESFGLKVACGILFNHESHRRPVGFLTRKITDHVCSLKDRNWDGLVDISPLELGNLKVRRDWGYAPDYVDGIIRVMRQIDIRSQLFLPEHDVASSYRDYVLGTGNAWAVWELVDRAFRLVNHDLVWSLDGESPSDWSARFAASDEIAVLVNPEFLRPNDPLEIVADPRAAVRELGWQPDSQLDRFLQDMLSLEVESW